MPIPSRADRQLASPDDLAAGVLISLRTLRHTPTYEVEQVRERLRAFVDAVTDAANDILATR